MEFRRVLFRSERLRPIFAGEHTVGQRLGGLRRLVEPEADGVGGFGCHRTKLSSPLPACQRKLVGGPGDDRGTGQDRSKADELYWLARVSKIGRAYSRERVGQLG